MQVIQAGSVRAGSADARIVRALEEVTEDALRELVETLATPRHFEAEPEANRRTGAWIETRLRSYGYETCAQGPWANVVALPAGRMDKPLVLIGAHYDSVPGSPGADDNASAVAALLECARCLGGQFPGAPVAFVAFNREEDGLAGSRDFVREYLPGSGLSVREAHVLEMVGYRDGRSGSQRLPADLPIRIADVGDFLGLVANQRSHAVLGRVLRTAKGYVGGLPVLGLKVYLGLEKRFPHLRRSDHDPFWEAKLPAVMWTDTAEFRNPHYHRPTDTPETLDYAFLRDVTRLLVAVALGS